MLGFHMQTTSLSLPDDDENSADEDTVSLSLLTRFNSRFDFRDYTVFNGFFVCFDRINFTAFDVTAYAKRGVVRI